MYDSFIILLSLFCFIFTPSKLASKLVQQQQQN